MKCHFCNRKAVGEPCRWPVRIFIATTYSELIEGDIVRRISKKLDHRAPARVHEINPTTFVGLRTGELQQVPGKVTVTLAMRKGKGDRYKQIVVMGVSRVRVESTAFCNADTCERHQRELGPKKTVCQDHWRAWEEIA